jgi:hypothetical protein
LKIGWWNNLNFVLQKSSSILKKKIFFFERKIRRKKFSWKRKKKGNVHRIYTVSNMWCQNNKLVYKNSSEWHSLFSIIISLKQEKKCPNQYKQIFFCTDYELFYCRRNYLIFIFLCCKQHNNNKANFLFDVFKMWLVHEVDWNGHEYYLV